MRQWRGTGRIQPTLGIAKRHLAAVVLDEVADKMIMQIYVEGFRHALLFFLGHRRRRRKSQLDSQGLQDCQRFSDLAGLFPLFEINDEPQPRAGCKRQILLSDAQALARGLDEAADLLGCVFQAPPSINVPVRE